MASQEDSELARKALARKLASAEELERCQARQVELRRKGVNKTLAEILIETGCVSRNQIARLNEAADQDSLHRPAQQIPGYQILEKLGAGTTATVFKAKQLDIDRMVAIKVLPKRFSERVGFVECFYRAARTLGSLRHPNIVEAIDVGRAAGYHYLVMEFIDGCTVREKMSVGVPTQEVEALRIMLGTACALEHAHERGFIHRDVKPRSIMLTTDKQVKLINWDLARPASDDMAAESEAGQAFGTPYYMSPEQIRGEMNIDFRADIYALGATFYHMVTGRVPFEGPTPSAIMHKHLRQPLTPPDHINPELRPDVGELVELMMAKDRDERYPSTSELTLALKALLKGQPLPPIGRK